MNTSMTIIAITGVAVAAIALLPRLVRGNRGTLQAGDRVRLSGGYDDLAEWLEGREFIDGEVLSFIDVTAGRPAAVVRLSEPVSAGNFTSNIAVLHLRYDDARWSGGETVHVQLWRHVPTAADLDDQSSVDRKWVESHATYVRT